RRPRWSTSPKASPPTCDVIPCVDRDEYFIPIDAPGEKPGQLLFKTSRNSSWPWSSVLTGPKLGFGMFQSENVIGIEPLIARPDPFRSAFNVNVTFFVVPCIVRLPVT